MAILHCQPDWIQNLQVRLDRTSRGGKTYPRCGWQHSSCWEEKGKVEQVNWNKAYAFPVLNFLACHEVKYWSLLHSLP